jgi:hypothetical protein
VIAPCAWIVKQSAAESTNTLQSLPLFCFGAFCGLLSNGARGVRSSREWLHYAGGMVKELFVQVCILAAPWNRPEAWYRLSYRNILRVQGWMTPKTQCWLPMLSSASKRVEQKLKTEEGRRQSLRWVNRADVCNTS